MFREITGGGAPRRARLAATVALATLLGLGAAAPSLAQEAASGGLTIEELIVTARKRTEVLQSVPAAVSALSSDQIAARGVKTPSDIFSSVPNVQVSSPYGDAQPIFSIRGVSMSDYSSIQPSPIGVYVDEAHLGATYTHGMAMFDLERIEALRGPQGTLYGKNTTGGAINFITRTPGVSDEFGGYVTIGAGDYNLRTVEGAVAGAVVPDRLAVRLAVSAKKDDGYYENRIGPDMGQTDFRAARLTVAAQLGDNVTAVAKYLYGRSDPLATPPRGEGAIPVPGLGQVDFTGYARPDDLGYHEGDVNKVGIVDTRLDQGSLRLTWDTDLFSVVSVTSAYKAYFDQDANTDGTPMSLLEIHWHSTEKSWAEDLRIASNLEGPLDFIAGVYYGYQDISLYNRFAGYRSPLPIVAFSDPALATLLGQWGMAVERMATERRSFAVYGQASYDFNDRLSIDVGLRWTKDDDRLTDINVSRLDAAGNPVGSFVPGNILGVDAPFLPPGIGGPTGFYLDGPYTTASGPRDKVENDAVSGKFGVNFKLTPDVLTYASYSRGYRSGNYNSGIYYAVREQEALYAKPETLDSYEAGVKGEFFQNRLRLNAAAFFYDYKNQQFINVVGVSNFLTNAGGAEIRGFEVEAIARVTRGLTLTGSLGLLDSEFTELMLADTTTPAPDDMIDLKGNELISSPELTAAVAVDYEFRPTDAFRVRLHADADYRSHQYFSAYNGKIGYDAASQDAYWLVNARATILSPDERLSLSVYAKNLFDQEYDVYAINLVAGFGYNYFLEGAPRRIGAELSYKF